MCVCEQRFAGFKLLQTEFQLRDALIELFGGASKMQAAQPRQLHFELVDLDLAGEKQRTLLEDELLQALDVVG